LFAGPGYGPTAPAQVFVSAAPTYTFNFSPCSSIFSLENTLSKVSAQLGMARYVRIFNTGTGVLNLNEVITYDCNGTVIPPTFATLSTAHGAGPAFNCINNDNFTSSDFCHSNAAANNWLEIDLGYAQPVGRVVIRNRIDCCGDRIRGFRIGLYNGPMGTYPVGQTQLISTVAANYTFTNLATCTSVGAISNRVEAVSSATAANTFILQNVSAARLNASISAVESQLVAESSLIAAINQGGSGANLYGTVMSVATVASTATTNLGTLSTTVNTLSTTTSASVSSINSAAVTFGLTVQNNANTIQTMSGQVGTLMTGQTSIATSLSSLKSSLVEALNAAMTAPASTTPQITTSGTMIGVSGGTCSNSDLCDAVAFAAALKNSLANI